MKLTRTIPIFPLKLVVFPGEELNLHVFEPRYKQLISECKEHDLTFGIPAFIDDRIMSVGTEVQLSKIHQVYEDGRMDISTKAVDIFRIHEVLEHLDDKLYSGAVVEAYPFETEDDKTLNQEIYLKILELFKALQIEKQIPAYDQISSFNIGHFIGLNLDQEYELLQIQDEKSRQHYILQHLNQILPVARQMNRIRKKAKMNGHFQEFDKLDF